MAELKKNYLINLCMYVCILQIRQRELFMYFKQMSKIDLHFMMISGNMEDELIMVIEVSRVDQHFSNLGLCLW